MAAQRIEDYRAGYPRLCALIEAYDGFMICRRFKRLRSRVLLLKQDRLSRLEEQLDMVDRDEALPLFLGKSRGDINPERVSIISQIETSLAGYDSFIETTTKVLKSHPVISRDCLSLRNWLEGNGCVSRLETAYLENEADLMNLVGPGDRATSQLEAWIEDKLIDYCPGFRTLPSHKVSTDANLSPSGTGRHLYRHDGHGSSTMYHYHLYGVIPGGFICSDKRSDVRVDIGWGNVYEGLQLFLLYSFRAQRTVDTIILARKDRQDHGQPGDAIHLIYLATFILDMEQDF
ncbi:hypothetical protein F4808DRAFT_475170 [Astrocystis sublimbata]|nr:hypothetical protein F4808DRAFT_475170 [Astrocystis sublimbata]